MSEHTVAFEASDHRFTCGEHETLLHGALARGIAFPYECSTGACGTCRFELLRGEIETLWPDAPGLSERMRAKGRHLACQTRPRTDLVIKAHPEDRCRPPVPPMTARAMLSERTALTHDMVEFVFQTREPAAFMPGQYVLLRWPGTEGARAYSMCNLPNDAGEWRLIVKRKHGGAMTVAMIDGAEPGQTAELSGPYGMAYLDGTMVGDILCIAGGSGLSPALSVARAALARPPGARVELFYGARTPGDLVDLAALSGGVASLRAVSSVSEDGGDWDGARGFVHEVARRQATLSPDAHVFVAGPPPMIAASLSMLSEAGVPRAQVHFDSFY